MIEGQSGVSEYDIPAADIPVEGAVAFFPILEKWLPDQFYPGLRVSQPVFGVQGEYIGREFLLRYPINAINDPEVSLWDLADLNEEEARQDRDPDGWRALRLGGAYYDEAMDCVDLERRVDCFRAAELLYLHSAARGNVIGRLCLGYIYSYDRCEGNYLRTWYSLDGNDDDLLQPFPIEEEACACFKDAAEAGVAEGCYKYGDMLKAGRGCEADPAEAFRQFQRGYDLGRNQHPVIWGSSALRIAACYEEGSGTEQHLSKALSWYEKAEAGLDIAVRDGETWHKGRLKQACSGIVRMKQEISGAY